MSISAGFRSELLSQAASIQDNINNYGFAIVQLQERLDDVQAVLDAFPDEAEEVEVVVLDDDLDTDGPTDVVDETVGKPAGAEPTEPEPGTAVSADEPDAPEPDAAPAYDESDTVDTDSAEDEPEADAAQQ